VLREQLGSISCTQNSLLLLSEFSVDVRTRFFLLSLLPFLSSFFGKKEERNEELNEKELLIEKL